MNGQEKPGKNTKRKAVGRPSLYDSERHPMWAQGLARLGKTHAEIAAEFGVSEDTIFEWKKVHPEFSVSINIGKSEADTKVERSLYMRANGYEIDCLETTNHPDGTQTVKKITKHIPPDTTAQIFWLKNRKPVEWKDKQQQEITGKDGGPVILSHMSDEEVIKRAREILGK